MIRPMSEDDQRRDALLLRLLRTPPESRAEVSERVRRAKGLKSSPQPRPKRERTKESDKAQAAKRGAKRSKASASASG